jgi:putative ABC transport system permease protein
VIDLDRWVEIVEGLARHPLRTALTMGSVAWGTFVLVVLLGTGEGLQNSVQWQFRDDATNSVWVYRGQTSKPFAGRPVGRRVQFTTADYEAVRAEVDGIEHMTGRFYIWARARSRTRTARRRTPSAPSTRTTSGSRRP